MPVDIFAKLGDIKGESTDSKHKGEIEVLSFSWGVSNTPATSGGSGAAAGRPDFQNLTITHQVDKASPALLHACATGLRLKDATITHRKAGKGQHEYLVVKLNDVTITGVSHGGGADAPAPESISLTFAKVDFEYRFQRPDGTVDAGLHFKYDLRNHKTF